MKKKIISLLLIAVIAVSSAVIITGCGDSDYPVNVANLTIKKQPKKIVVLDPNAADIISYIGYDVNMIGRSDEVNQESLSIVPSFGSAVSPDMNAIIEGNADMVFVSSGMSEENKAAIKDKGIEVVTLYNAKTQTELETNYTTLGKILGGKISGALKGKKAYDELIAEMDARKAEAEGAKESDIPPEVCYLYSENNQLKMMTNGTYGDMLLGYTGAVNVAVNVIDSEVDYDTLKVANPDYIFYDDEETLEIIKADATLKSLNAVKSNKLLRISEEEMTRQGYTALETLDKMIGFIYPSLAQNNASTPDEATNTQPATEAPKSLADDYKIKLKDLKLEYEQENDNVLAMQKRLFDLGYIDDKENVTGYYGDITKSAVEDFQKKNDIEKTGKADNKTLEAMFMDNAVPKKEEEAKKSDESSEKTNSTKPANNGEKSDSDNDTEE